MRFKLQLKWSIPLQPKSIITAASTKASKIIQSIDQNISWYDVGRSLMNLIQSYSLDSYCRVTMKKIIIKIMILIEFNVAVFPIWYVYIYIYQIVDELIQRIFQNFSLTYELLLRNGDKMWTCNHHVPTIWTLVTSKLDQGNL